MYPQFSSVAQSCPTLCDPMDCSTPGLPVHYQFPVYPNSCPLNRWCHPTISSSVQPFSSCPQSFPASGSFQMSQFFTSGGQSIGVSDSTSVLPMNAQDWPPLGWTGWISLQSKGLSRVFSNTLSYPLLNEFSVLGTVLPLLCLISLHSNNSQCKLSKYPDFIPFTKLCHDSYCFFSLLYIYFLVSLMSNVFMVSTSGWGRYNNLSHMPFLTIHFQVELLLWTQFSVDCNWCRRTVWPQFLEFFFFFFLLPNYWPFPVSCLSLKKLVILTLKQFPWIPSYSKLSNLSSFWFLCCFVHGFLSFSSI